MTKQWILFVFLIWGSFGFAENQSEVTAPKSLRSINFRTNPFNIISRTPSIDIDLGVSPSFTIGPTFMLGGISGEITSEVTVGNSTTKSITPYRLELLTFGVRSHYYFTGERFSDGWYLSPFVTVTNELYAENGPQGTTSSLGVGSYLGHQIVWSSGLNLNLAMGFSYQHIVSSSGLNGERSSLIPALYQRRQAGVIGHLDVSLGFAI